MRIVKEAEERRGEILDAADRLFGERGFDGTSTNDILEAVGIARGTLYYHFASKEEILDALVERYAERCFAAARRAASDRSIPAVERIIRVLLAANIDEGTGSEIIDQLHKPQNALMHQKSKAAVLGGLTPILAEVVREGVGEGSFDTPHPYECMELVVAYINEVFDEESVSLGAEERDGRLRALAYNMERLLGMPEGGLSRIVASFGGEAGARRG